eukprot:TRINITY_DN71737_c0_g1_i1.p2 TRINITY_DN71737_c0_g1~~TRINITY_DN71737_c0_g1_i1.p2  ORF type:complete len:180 (+),score=27.13 TRINITY_DN71737_c0_g1_i1:177-716(+)
MRVLALLMLLFAVRLPARYGRLATRASPTLVCSAREAHCNGALGKVVRMRSTEATPRSDSALNVLGEQLQLCCSSPLTGFYRDGFCHTGASDSGVHTVCAVVTDEFLQYSRARGNDLMSAAPQFGFPGLKHGDRWCLCVSRWKEALEAGVAPPVVLAATHERALSVVTIEQLRAHAVDA